MPSLQVNEICEKPYLPWVSGDFSPKKEVIGEVMVPITIVQTGDHETAYELAVPAECSVKNLKARVEAECQGLLKADALEFRQMEEEPPLADSHVYHFSKGDLVIMNVKASAAQVEAPNMQALKNELKKKKGCSIQ
jgi:hypothetical protein